MPHELIKKAIKMEKTDKKCAIHDVSSRLYTLIDRLQKCSEIKYPNRKWSNDFYYECAFQWKDNIGLLEERVLKLEAELNGY